MFHKPGGSPEVERARPRWSSYEFLRLIEENGRLGTWQWDLASGVLDWSLGLYRIAGVDPMRTRITVNDCIALIHPDDRRGIADPVGFARDGRFRDRTFRVIRPDGQLRWLAARSDVVLDRASRPVMAVGVVYDITAERDTATALSKSDRRYRALLEMTADAVWFADAAGGVADCPDWTQLTGQNREEMAGNGWLDAIHPEDRDATWKTWSEAVTSRRQCALQYRLRRADGSYAWYRAYGIPIRDGRGTPLEWIGLCRRNDEAVASPSRQGGRLTGRQLRAARAVLNWSVRSLAEASGVSSSSIRRIEDEDVGRVVGDGYHDVLRATLEANGITFSQGSVGWSEPGALKS
jgi:PAS domain S-box-containing protein